jgi:FkbM family methyltransferase
VRFGVRLFLGIVRLAAWFPRFRGKTRALLLVYKVLRLEKRHILVWATLRRPVAFQARLDLHAWLQRVALLTGAYEDDTVEVLLDLQRRDGRDGYLLDVGANIGLIAIPFALLVSRPSPRVVAVEAVPDNVGALRANVERNDLPEAVTIVPVALGAERGVSQIQVEGDLKAGEGTGTANILPEGSTYECVRQEIAVETLDGLAGEGVVPPGCSVVKIDTDGYDLKVLQGATGFLRRERPVILGEFAEHCLRWHGQSLADVVAFAREHGYEVWPRIGASRFFMPYEEPARDAYVQDLLLVPSERVASFEPLLRRGA